VEQTVETQWFRDNSARFRGELLWDEPLSRHTYYRIGGPALLLAFPRGEDDLSWLGQGIMAGGLPHFFLGSGSNVLASDLGFPGVVIRCTRLDSTIEPLAAPGTGGELLVRTGAGVSISSLLRRSAQEGWGGFELWTGIPGSVGGAVAMNAGTHLGETQAIAESVRLFSLRTLSTREVRGDGLRFFYRGNRFLGPDEVVVSAVWRVASRPPEEVAAVIRETLARRKASQPIDYPSCGSVFKNPKDSGLHAWQVIEKVGLRGYRVGGAEFSAKHCNFIVNLGGARSCDVQALIDEAKRRAWELLGIRLEEEVRRLPGDASAQSAV
jgi:UDP-N-acetylmuramate dehydrogenase